MNTNPNAITVLCYGDSNTWGQKENRTGRYPANIRWTGRTQELLGDDYYVIEEGLCGRTTDLEDSRPGLNGKTYLLPCILSHNPLDIVVVMLGTNDMKVEFNRSVQDIADAVKGLVEDIQNNARNKNDEAPKILIVSPIYIDDAAPRFAEFYAGRCDHNSVIKSIELARELSKAANQTGVHFLDASTVAKPGIDGVHMNEESHPALGSLVATTIQKIL